MVEVLAPAVSQGFKHRWVPFIQQVYEARPLFCSQCGSAMRIIAFIEQLEITEKSRATSGCGRHLPTVPPNPLQLASRLSERSPRPGSAGFDTRGCFAYRPRRRRRLRYRSVSKALPTSRFASRSTSKAST